MSKFYKRLVQPSRPSDPTLTSASGLWTIRDQRLAQASGIWPNGVIPTINYLAIGGGGGGAGQSGTSGGGSGSGGAGGLIVGSFGPVYKQTNSMYGYTLTINIGAGGTSAGGTSGTNGGDTTISGQFFTLGTLTAYGGGYGPFRGSGSKGGDGGSGGGQAGWNDGIAHANLPGLALQPTSLYGGYGNSGGYHNSGGTGGGGAGGPGGTGAAAATGGAGLYVDVASASSYSRIFGRGGTLFQAADGTGSGGGGAQASLTPYSPPGKFGNKGTVILWWDASYNNPSIITGTYTYTKENNYKIYEFTSSGTITF